jgi:hypothetical protein
MCGKEAEFVQSVEFTIIDGSQFPECLPPIGSLYLPHGLTEREIWIASPSIVFRPPELNDLTKAPPSIIGGIKRPSKLQTRPEFERCGVKQLPACIIIGSPQHNELRCA